jgi:hypothetical protein
MWRSEILWLVAEVGRSVLRPYTCRGLRVRGGSSELLLTPGGASSAPAGARSLAEKAEAFIAPAETFDGNFLKRLLLG